jgi:GTP-binding protein Era
LFVDTPGYIRSGSSLWANHFSDSLKSATKEADVVLLLTDPESFQINKSKKFLQNFIASDKLIIAINKADLESRGVFYEMIAEIVELGYKETVFLISAKDGSGVQDLENEILSRAKEKEWTFENNEEVKLSKDEYAAQCVREKAFYCLKEELPFYLWTVTTKSNFNKKPWNIYIDLVVGKKSHKGIVIGKNAQQLKQIGEAARTELQLIWGEGQLFLNVVVDEKSLQNPDFVKYICNKE